MLKDSTICEWYDNTVIDLVRYTQSNAHCFVLLSNIYMIDPSAFGANPSGHSDSSPGMAAAVAAMLELVARRTPSGLKDFWGAVLDLSGGILQP